MNYVEKQVALWEQRVFFPNERFKENGPADLDELTNIIKESYNKDLTIISAPSESCVYKIGRYFIENNFFDNSRIAFQNGEDFEIFIDTDVKYDSQIRDLCMELEKTLGDVKNKWIFIPELNNQWSKKYAIYFLNRLRQIGVYGIVFYSDKNYPDTLAQILCQDCIFDVFQYPKKVYKERKIKKDLPEDEF